MNEEEQSKYLNGNPAIVAVWADALSRIEEGVELAPVQRIVVREWYTRASARRELLLLKSQRGFLHDEEYAEIHTLNEMLEKIRKFQ